jgi:serine protease Do
MRHPARALCLAVLPLLPLPLVEPAARAGVGPLARLKELDRALEAVAERAGGSVACILVSRSAAYHKAPYWGVPAEPDAPWKLGRFDAAAAARKVPEGVRNRASLLRAIRAHDLSDPATVPESYGSGVVIDEKGLVLTCAHVVRHATRVYVRLPGGRGSWADIHAADARSDLAVLRLLDPVRELRPVKLGGGGKVRPGQIVLTLSNAWAPGFRRDARPSAAWGVVSALRQKAGNADRDPRKVTLHYYGTLIATDARTTTGCSGGALVNLEGEVVGLTTALAGIRGEGSPGDFAVPMSAPIRRIVEVLRRGEEVEYGFLGVQMQTGGGFGRGVNIWQVSRGSPAARAGLLRGDYIVAIDGKPVRSNEDLFLLVGMGLAGSTVRVETARTPDGPRRTTTVKLAKYYVPGPVIAAHRPPARGGLRVDYTSLLSQRGPFVFWGRGPADGVMIREVVPGSAADKAHLQPDKIISHVNGRAVTTPAEYYQEMGRAGKRAELTVLTSDDRPERVSLDLE